MVVKRGGQTGGQTGGEAVEYGAAFRKEQVIVVKRVVKRVAKGWWSGHVWRGAHRPRRARSGQIGHF